MNIFKKAKLAWAGLLFLVFSMTSFAEQNPQKSDMYYFSNNDLTIKGYGGPKIGTSNMFDNNNLMVGLSGGAAINGFIVGGAINAVTSDISTNLLSANNKKMSVGMSYGGLLLGYETSNSSPIQFSISSLFGGGILTVKEQAGTNEDYLFSITEPEVAVTFQMTQYLRLKTSVSQRYISNYSGSSAIKNGLEERTIWINFEFGKFQ